VAGYRLRILCDGELVACGITVGGLEGVFGCGRPVRRMRTAGRPVAGRPSRLMRARIGRSLRLPVSGLVAGLGVFDGGGHEVGDVHGVLICLGHFLN